MSAPGKRAGVVGWPVAQSLSPVLHGYWLKEYGITGTYEAFAIRPETFSSAVQQLAGQGYCGVNVTVPHKAAAFALADARDEDANLVRAANLLLFESGRIHARNTDISGFATSVIEGLGADSVKGFSSVVLGAGGAARAIVLALARLGCAEIRLVNRTQAHAEALQSELSGAANIAVAPWGDWHHVLAGAELLVNATSLGMTGKPPLDLALDALPHRAAVIDIVYNPLETDLLRRARARGHRALDGLGMLMHQAVPAFAAFFGVTPKVTAGLRAALEEALRAQR